MLLMRRQLPPLVPRRGESQVSDRHHMRTEVSRLIRKFIGNALLNAIAVGGNAAHCLVIWVGCPVPLGTKINVHEFCCIREPAQQYTSSHQSTVINQ